MEPLSFDLGKLNVFAPDPIILLSFRFVISEVWVLADHFICSLGCCCVCNTSHSLLWFQARVGVGQAGDNWCWYRTHGFAFLLLADTHSCEAPTNCILPVARLTYVELSAFSSFCGFCVLCELVNVDLLHIHSSDPDQPNRFVVVSRIKVVTVGRIIGQDLE